MRQGRWAIGLLVAALLAWGLVAATGGPAAAATVTVTTDDMQYARQASPGATGCATWSLVNGTSGAVKRTFVSFPTAGVVPAGNDVTSVTLRLYPRATYSQNVTVKTYPRTAAGCDITWNNQAASGSQVGASTGGFTKNVYKSIALTPSSVSLTGRTGYAIDTTATSDLQFMTDGGANPAKLDITYAPTATTTTTTCGGPITITAGGTYSGCYQSTSSGTPAVTISTTAAVTLDHATIRHAGQGVTSTVRANLTSTDSTYEALAPTASQAEQQAVYLYQPAGFTFQHNRLRYGHGVLLNGDQVTTDPLVFSYNDVVDVGKMSQPTCGPQVCVGALHTDKVSLPSGGTVEWNRVTNTYGQSVTEDVYGFFQTDATSTAQLVLDHNLVNGNWPYSGDGSSFTGAAIDLADGGGSWQTGHDNTVVNEANVGLAINSGTDVHHYDSTVVSDGKAGATTVSSTFGNGINVWHNPSNPDIMRGSTHDTQTTLLRWNGTAFERSDAYTPDCDPPTDCGNITSLGHDPTAADEQAAVDAYEASVTAAGVVIGPRP